MQINVTAVVRMTVKVIQRILEAHLPITAASGLRKH